MLTKEQIIDKLKTVEDPELHVNIVDLGLIYNVDIDKNNNVNIKMTLTTPGCPLSFLFNQMVTSAVKSLEGVKEVKVELTFDPAWNPSRMSESAKEQLGWIG